MNFVTREQWGARPPTSTPSSINSTVTTGHWEGPHMGTFPHSSCATKVRGIQAYHMDQNGWSDVAYNGIACPHGYVFEGRGPGKRSAANGTNHANDISAVICYLGGQGDDFTNEGKQAMSDGAHWLGDPMEKGHRDWYATECPGQVIYDWIYSGGSVPAPKPKEEVDMTPGQCRDKVGRKWFFVVGDSREMFASIDGGNFFIAGPGSWSSGLDAFLEDDGTIVVAGRGSDGMLYQLLIWTDGSPTPGKAPVLDKVGGHIYPPA